MSLLIFAALTLGQVDAPPDRPNVLFIAVDDLNDWIAPLGGYEGIRTPNIDRLAATGVTFTRAYCAAPACNPSRTALLTGVRPSTSGVYHNPQPWREALPEAITVMERFREAGYLVEGAGKIAHGRYEDRSCWDDYTKSPGDPKPTPKVAKDPHSRAGGIVWGRLDADDEEMGDYAVAQYAIDRLGRSQDQPFFLACGIFRPHMPWQVPDKYYDMYPLDSIQLPDVPENDLSDIPPAGVRVAKPNGDHATVLKTDNWKHAVQAYLASITFADAQIGRVLDALENGPNANDTVVVLWGDHGWHLGEKQHWRKFALWEEATRVPLFFKVPRVTEAGSVCERPVNLLDVYPTLCGLCGIEPPKTVEGESLVPWLQDPSRPKETPSITTHGRNNHAVRSGRYRYIRYADGSEELYDHGSDPGEHRNIAGETSSKSIIEEHRRFLPKTNVPDSPYEKGKGGKKRRGT